MLSLFTKCELTRSEFLEKIVFYLKCYISHLALSKLKKTYKYKHISGEPKLRQDSAWSLQPRRPVNHRGFSSGQAARRLSRHDAVAVYDSDR